MLHRPISAYARELRPLLSPAAFAPAHSRLLWLPVHVAIIVLSVSAIARGELAWPWQLLLSPLIGASFAGLTFLGHETLHGAVVRGRKLRRAVGFIGFLPFAVSPRLWIAWHNRVHHGHTNQPGSDPDAYPTLEEYNRSRTVKLVTEYGAPGQRRLRGVLALIVGFSIQSAQMLVGARKSGMLKPREHAWALAETAFGLGVWAALAVLIGPFAFLFAYVLPIMVANAIVMGLILTNHSLSPHTKINDPLANSLSVTGPRLIEWVTLGFGFHVEHHLFPAMSARHAPEVRRAVLQLWPEQYQSLPFLDAMWALHLSPRVYETATMLIDPKTGTRWPALAPTSAPVGLGLANSAAALTESPAAAPAHVPRRVTVGAT